MANKVEKWREALTQIASLVGKDTATCEDEAMMIDDIVEGISKKLFVMQPVDFSDLVGMENHMERLSPLLCMESEDEVRMVGIWGMGGIGKTTIARCLFNRFSRLFPSRCFIENVSKICREHGVSSLREKFISTTLCTLSEKSSVELGPQEIKARFENLKVFAVFDNVDDVKHVHALAKDFAWLGRGSRIIITTRDKGLLNSCGVKIVYEVKCLDSDDALEMFNQLAFEGGFPPTNVYEKLSIRASCLAQGLPAAIEAYGLFFRGVESYMEWKDALCRFIRAPNEHVIEILKISYNGLEEADRIVFLHVACLLKGEPLRRATTLLDDGELQGCLSIKILAEKSLIEITAGGYIKIHSLVDQTLKAILKQESMHKQGGGRVLWDPDEICKVLKRNGTNDPTECMALHMCDMVHAVHLNVYSIYQDDTLRFLKVYKHLDHMETKLRLGSSDAYLLSSRLRLLHWDAFPLTTFPHRFRPLDLVEISLHRSNLTSFWKETVGMRNLRRLDLSGSEKLEELPDLSMAVNLEELITQGCKRLKRIPESISNLTRLTKLDLSYCDDLSSYHITIRELAARCRQIALYFSGEEMEMESIENLSIGGNIHIQMLWLDGNADHLCFSTEQQAPDELTKREQQQPPMSEFHGFNLVEIIRFNYKSVGASFLCYSLSMFPFLKELNLINLNIEVIPDDVCVLKSLQKLDWSGNDFETLPETMNQLPKLKHVSLCNCRRLEALPELVQVETVKLSGCKNLQSLFKTSHAEKDWDRWQLRELWVDNCNIQSISEQLGNFIKLSYVDLSSNDFETLPSSMGNLSFLRTLCLNKCKRLNKIEGFPLCLKYLYAHGCESLETISFPLNHSVKHLDLSHCFCLKHNEHPISQFLTKGQDEEDSPRFACFPGTEVLVKCIIDQDPKQRIDESTLTWRDELVDEKIDYLQELIEKGHRFTIGTFKGGASKADVEHMKVEGKGQAKQRKSRKKSSATGNAEREKEENIVIGNLHARVVSVESKLEDEKCNMEELKSKYSQLEETLTRTFQEKFDQMKKDMVESLSGAIRDEVIRQIKSSELDCNVDKGPRNEFEVEETEHEAAIRNVLGNIEQYTFPRETSRTCAGIYSSTNSGNKSPRGVEATGRGSTSYQSHKNDRVDEVSQYKALEDEEEFNEQEGVDQIKNQTMVGDKDDAEDRSKLLPNGDMCTNVELGHRKEGDINMNSDVEEDNMIHEMQEEVPNNQANSDGCQMNSAKNIVSPTKEGMTNASGPVIEDPSFSLGLTQEELANVEHEDSSNEREDDGIGVTNLCRKSKRQRTIPPVLLTDYHCPPILVTRARESQKRLFDMGDSTMTLKKFEDLESKLNRHLKYRE
ncbi:unnamed protein product [Eruca vesicaria subsp. sativa]|uniref:NB-ARC domain-containing protein n=1 Tax=Eruca vesicaria subsp. sativa TaxID=29727 RepID=A0ABC8JPX6_ERUVS|nr:unnamed protein product [Eruca vesicaria subsp. sativa]